MNDDDRRQIWRHVYALEFHRQAVAFCELVGMPLPTTARELADNPGLVVAPLRLAEGIVSILGKAAGQAADLAVRGLGATDHPKSE